MSLKLGVTVCVPVSLASEEEIVILRLRSRGKKGKLVVILSYCTFLRHQCLHDVVVLVVVEA